MNWGIVFTREQMDEIVRDVKNSAYEIIEKKGATFYAVALAIRRIAEALIRDEHFPVDRVRVLQWSL